MIQNCFGAESVLVVLNSGFEVLEPGFEAVEPGFEAVEPVLEFLGPGESVLEAWELPPPDSGSKMRGAISSLRTLIRFPTGFYDLESSPVPNYPITH